MRKSEFLKEKMKKQKISKIIFSKVLEMPLMKYLSYIEKAERRFKKKPFNRPQLKKNILC